MEPILPLDTNHKISNLKFDSRSSDVPIVKHCRNRVRDRSYQITVFTLVFTLIKVLTKPLVYFFFLSLFLYKQSKPCLVTLVLYQDKNGNLNFAIIKIRKFSTDLKCSRSEQET
jgi:hypothetical protein